MSANFLEMGSQYDDDDSDDGDVMEDYGIEDPMDYESDNEVERPPTRRPPRQETRFDSDSDGESVPTGNRVLASSSDEE